jgi:hypothetical protein
MKRLIMAIIAGLALVLLPAIARAAEDDHDHHPHGPAVDVAARSVNCWPSGTPVGALPSQPPPVFCSIEAQGPDTAVAGDNTWLDEFDHGLSLASFAGTRYKVFENLGFVHRTLHWRHADHWMVDVASPRGYPAGWNRGGAMMRPDQPFRFVNGKLVIEADVAAGMTAYGTNAWPELLISTGATPTDIGGLYGYEMFPENPTLGCRIQASRYPVCELKAGNGSLAANRFASRVYEISAHQPAGATNFGGSPFQGREDAWRVCRHHDDLDVLCRDRFRLELTATTLTLYVNGTKYFEQTGLPPLPAALTSGDVFVYFNSMVVSHQADSVRFHWDRLAVNPTTAPTPAPGTGPTTIPVTTTSGEICHLSPTSRPI